MDEAERDVRRNLALIRSALARGDWPSILRLAEGLVRVAVAQAAAQAAGHSLTPQPKKSSNPRF
ncbi:MAG TPA: hypothetical protein VMW52_13690 [Phycisphaerae bacterium]|nr:hypothetical protein [Phycisphaerae bacterium]